MLHVETNVLFRNRSVSPVCACVLGPFRWRVRGFGVCDGEFCSQILKLLKWEERNLSVFTQEILKSGFKFRTCNDEAFCPSFTSSFKILNSVKMLQRCFGCQKKLTSEAQTSWEPFAFNSAQTRQTLKLQSFYYSDRHLL